MRLETINKKYLLGMTVVLIFIPLFLLFIRPSSNNLLFPGNITPTPFKDGVNSDDPNSPLRVVSTSPQDKSLNAPLDSLIIVTFNRTPRPNEFRFSSSPELPGEFDVEGKKLILKPVSALLPSTKYIIALGLLDVPGKTGVYGFSFYTLGPTPSPFPDTRSVELEEQDEEIQRQTRPDVFLRNETPYSDSSFSVTSAHTSTPTGHFYFSVWLLGANKDTSKTAFKTWVKSKGLIDSQIQNLDIRYQ